MDALKSHRDRSLLHTRTEASASSSGSYSIPSPQLVEKSGVSTPDGFFYQLEEDTAPPDLSEKVKSWTRGLDPASLKRYLEPLQARKLTTAEQKHRDTAVKTANLIRQKQRAFSPLLTLEKPAHIGTRKLVLELDTGRSDSKPQQAPFRPVAARIIRPTELVRKSVKPTVTVRSGQVKPLQKSVVKQTSFKAANLKPLRSLTPQIGRQVPSRVLPR